MQKKLTSGRAADQQRILSALIKKGALTAPKNRTWDENFAKFEQLVFNGKHLDNSKLYWWIYGTKRKMREDALPEDQEQLLLQTAFAV